MIRTLSVQAQPGESATGSLEGPCMVEETNVLLQINAPLKKKKKRPQQRRELHLKASGILHDCICKSSAVFAVRTVKDTKKEEKAI